MCTKLLPNAAQKPMNPIYLSLLKRNFEIGLIICTAPERLSCCSNVEPFKVNLTAACNFNCLCTETDMEPVCGNNGLTYFSPCHAGCAAFSSRSNFTNCACQYCLLDIFYNRNWRLKLIKNAQPQPLELEFFTTWNLVVMFVEDY